MKVPPKVGIQPFLKKALMQKFKLEAYKGVSKKFNHTFCPLKSLEIVYELMCKRAIKWKVSLYYSHVNEAAFPEWNFF